MSTSFKSRIPERVKHSLTALHGPNSRVSRSRSIARPNRCTMYRSKLPLPIRMLTALVREEPPEAVAAATTRPETERETEAVIRSLVRRSIPPAVRGNRTSFRRIQLAHSSPQVASVSLTMKPQIRWQNASALSPPQKPHTVQLPVPKVVKRKRPEDEVVSAKSLIELVAGKWQPEMKMMRFLCSDHRLINVPSRLMYRYSEVMCSLEVEEQPIELRAIRSVTLLRVVMWMHQKSLNGNGELLSAGLEQSCICADQSIAQEKENGNGNENENTENSCEITENTQENDASIIINTESIINQMFDAYSDSEEETTEDSSESSENSEENDSAESIDFEMSNGYRKYGYENTKNSCERTERMRNRIFKVYNKRRYANAENSCENYENAENLIYKKLNGYTEGGNEKLENCILSDICKMTDLANGMHFRNAGNITSNTGNTQMKPRTGNDFNKVGGNEPNANGNGSDKENTINNVYGNHSQDRFVISPTNTGIFRESSGNGIENGKEKGTIEGSSLSENIFRTSGKPNFSEINLNGNGNENRNASEQKVPNVENLRSEASELSSWEQRLLGSELYQLVELILAAHYLGVDSLTLLATQHFGELMAQRTRTERCLMLKIHTHLAGVRQTLDTHRPRIREIMTQEKNQNHLRPQRRSPAFAAVIKAPIKISSMRSSQRTGGPCAIETPTTPLCSNRHRHHQNCFYSRF